MKLNSINRLFKKVLFSLTIIYLIKSTTQLKTKQFLYDSSQMIGGGQFSSLCPCSLSYPPCCTKEFEEYICPCAPRPVCDACPNTMTSMHDSMMRLAMKDAYAQQEMANQAKLQLELFQKAQDYAKEIGVQELKAKQYASEVNMLTKKAQYARSMMFQAAAQVKVLSEQTVKAISPLGQVTKIIKAPMLEVLPNTPLVATKVSQIDEMGTTVAEKRMILSDKGTMVVQGKANDGMNRNSILFESNK